MNYFRPSRKSYYFAFLRESGIFKGHFLKTFVPTMCKSQENCFSLGSKISSIFENLIASMGQFGTFFILLVNRLIIPFQENAKPTFSLTFFWTCLQLWQKYLLHSWCIVFPFQVFSSVGALLCCCCPAGALYFFYFILFYPFNTHTHAHARHHHATVGVSPAVSFQKKWLFLFLKKLKIEASE